MSDFRLRDVGAEVMTETLLAPAGTVLPLRWAMREESLREAFCDSSEQALSASHLAISDLPTDDWYGSVMGIIQQVVSHHFGVKSTPPRLSPDDPSSMEWYGDTSGSNSEACGVPACILQLDDSRCLVFRMWHITARLGSWTKRFMPAAEKPWRSTQPTHVCNSRRR